MQCELNMLMKKSSYVKGTSPLNYNNNAVRIITTNVVSEYTEKTMHIKAGMKPFDNFAHGDPL